MPRLNPQSVPPSVKSNGSNGKGHAIKKSNRGAPSKYNEKKFPDAAYKLCARLGAEDKDIATAFGVTVDCISKWKVEYPEFLYSIKKGKKDWDDQNVVSALRKRALGYVYVDIDTKKTTIMLGRGENKVKAPVEEIIRHEKNMAPDVTACIFWLVNRQPDEWKHVARTIIQGDPKNPVKHKYEFDLTKLPKEELEQLEHIITRARRDQEAQQSIGETAGNA